MTEHPAHRDNRVTLRLTWYDEADAGYLYLTDIAPSEAVTQRVVENPVVGVGDVVLDFDREGRLLGVELLDPRLLPRRLHGDHP
jgi:uncharacterized protein YuzE